MNRITMTLIAASLVAGLQAQTNPLIAEAKAAYTGIKNNLTKMAEKMPDEHYSFKASPDIRPFGALIAHVADSQAGTCSSQLGERKSVDAGKKTAKAELVAALKQSFEYCDAAFAALTDANAMELLKTPRGQVSRIGALIRNTTHDNEEYGYMAVYLRLKSIVPPSSEGR